MRTVVVGGGPAGMIAAKVCADNGDDVVLLEKNEMLGKKILITGKGRCNITSSLDMDEFIKNTPGNGRFLYSAFDNFTNMDIINLLKKGYQLRRREVIEFFLFLIVLKKLGLLWQGLLKKQKFLLS